MESPKTVLAAVVIWRSAAAAQPYVISTYAGGAPPVATPVPATSVSIDYLRCRIKVSEMRAANGLRVTARPPVGL